MMRGCKGRNSQAEQTSEIVTVNAVAAPVACKDQSRHSSPQVVAAGDRARYPRVAIPAVTSTA